MLQVACRTGADDSFPVEIPTSGCLVRDGQRTCRGFSKRSKQITKHELVGERLLVNAHALRIPENREGGCGPSVVLLRDPTYARGGHISRSIDELVKEAVITCQKWDQRADPHCPDLTYYGLDIYKKNLSDLMR